MEESPFYPLPVGSNGNGAISFSIYVEPYLNTYYQSYTYPIHRLFHRAISSLGTALKHEVHD
jgi:hypothetical protein